mmetsp:Transcript_33855/g.88082  ORF Transcript_33855/g.88082 Transcript_33855/m.88082 type:complete len:444 (-) Transcript_33855:491-1822(-)
MVDRLQVPGEDGDHKEPDRVEEQDGAAAGHREVLPGVGVGHPGGGLQGELESQPQRLRRDMVDPDPVVKNDRQLKPHGVEGQLPRRVVLREGVAELPVESPLLVGHAVGPHLHCAVDGARGQRPPPQRGLHAGDPVLVEALLEHHGEVVGFRLLTDQISLPDREGRQVPLLLRLGAAPLVLLHQRRRRPHPQAGLHVEGHEVHVGLPLLLRHRKDHHVRVVAPRTHIADRMLKFRDPKNVNAAAGHLHIHHVDSEETVVASQGEALAPRCNTVHLHVLQAGELGGPCLLRLPRLLRSLCQNAGVFVRVAYVISGATATLLSSLPPHLTGWDLQPQLRVLKEVHLPLRGHGAEEVAQYPTVVGEVVLPLVLQGDQRIHLSQGLIRGRIPPEPEVLGAAHADLVILPRVDMHPSDGQLDVLESQGLLMLPPPVHDLVVRLPPQGD